MRAEDTAKPLRPVPRSNPETSPASASTAPLITAVSKPKRKPPSAAAILTAITRRLMVAASAALDMTYPRIVKMTRVYDTAGLAPGQRAEP